MSSEPKPDDGDSKGKSLFAPAMLLCGSIILPFFSLLTLGGVEDASDLGQFILIMAILLILGGFLAITALILTIIRSGSLWAKIIIIALSSIVVAHDPSGHPESYENSFGLWYVSFCCWGKGRCTLALFEPV